MFNKNNNVEASTSPMLFADNHSKRNLSNYSTNPWWHFKLLLYVRDTFSFDIQQLNSHGALDPNDHLNNFQFKDGLLYFKGLLYVLVESSHLQII